MLGIKLAHTGVMGPGFTGPLSLAILLLYRLVQFIIQLAKGRCLIDTQNSNWFTTKNGRRVFIHHHLIALAGNFIPNILGLITLSMAFKYAALGGLNQGILPTLTSLAGVYSAIIFYFKFAEKISFPQFIGMFLMIISVVFLGLEGATKKFSIDSPN